nr:hypothetical protein [uncultured Methanospirillum sp.]
MQCDRCRMPAVCHQRYSGRYLCADHLSADIEARAKRVIRQNHWLVRGDRIGVFTGMRGSAPLLVFLEKLLKQRSDISIIMLTIPDSRREESVPGLILSEIAEEAGITRLALPDTAEDIAVRTLEVLFGNNVDLLLDDSHPGISLPVMQPFREIPSEELKVYAEHHGVSGVGSKSPGNLWKDPDNPLRNLLSTFSSRHPSAPHALRHYRDHIRLLAEED